MKRLIFALAMLPGVALAQTDGWTPSCTDLQAVFTGNSDLPEMTQELRKGAYFGIVEGWNLALGEAKAVTLSDVLRICIISPDTEFIAAIRGASLARAPRIPGENNALVAARLLSLYPNGGKEFERMSRELDPCRAEALSRSESLGCIANTLSQVCSAGDKSPDFCPVE
jgi:hypothetical protein